MTRLKTLKTRELANKLRRNSWVINRSTESDRGKISDCDIIAVKNGRVVFLNVVVVETGFRRKDVSSSSSDLSKCVTNGSQLSGGVSGSGGANVSAYNAICKAQGDETVEWGFVDKNITVITPSTSMDKLYEALL